MTYEIKLADGAVDLVDGPAQFEVGQAGELKVSEVRWTLLHTAIFPMRTYAPGTWLRWSRLPPGGAV